MDRCGYSGVWHLQETPADDGVARFIDSSVNGNNGQDRVTIGNSKMGILNPLGGQRFIAANTDYILIPANGTLKNNSHTISAWMYIVSFSSQFIYAFTHAATNTGTRGNYSLAARNFPYYWSTMGAYSTATSTGTAFTGDWHHVMIEWDDTTNKRRWWIDGVLVSDASVTVSVTVDDTYSAIGGVTDAAGTVSQIWNGWLDEVRVISPYANNAYWGTAEWMNVAKPWRFYTIGPEDDNSAQSRLMMTASDFEIVSGGNVMRTIVPSTDLSIISDGTRTMVSDSSSIMSVDGEEIVESGASLSSLSGASKQEEFVP